MKKQFLLLILSTLFAMPLVAQEFNLSGELRPRYENRYGFASLRSDGDAAGNFISQRTRINFDFKNSKMVFKVILQNVRVWGDVSTLASNDKSIAFHEAWAEGIISDKIRLKIGRQEIAYDDQRIFGSSGWAQQARSHDALLLKITPNTNHKLDLGIAYNADNQTNIDNLYSNIAGYKAFQYAWYHGDFKRFGLSFLFLNNGIQYINNEGLPSENIKVDYSQTIGPRTTYKSDNFSIDAAFYLQTGKSYNKSIDSNYFGGNFNYVFSPSFNVTIGGEHFSGRDMDESSNDIKSFKPLFGSNHKFNGLMDYFYVGNHANNVGLNDIYLHLGFSKNNWSAKLSPHYLASSAKIINNENNQNLDNYLGAEIDLMIGYKINNIKIDAGYSQMFATESMETIKGGNSKLSNNWAWIMITFKPNFLNYKFNIPEKK
ncbi:MAG: hypothetical protein GY823_04240 [Flavobacteriaceae bacterium]|nr:hypothetical protein [Flavobacteriaceae bacterium]